MSKLTIRNTLSNKTEAFAPIDPGHVRMYVCGPTVYDLPHVGNARPAVVFDVLFRLLRHLYPKVTYARNITDIDDKINNRAREMGVSIRRLTDETLKNYQNTMACLGLLPPTHEPRATDHIPDMTDIIQKLIEKDHAYLAENHVLFRVSSDPLYGKLSNRNTDEMIAGARVEVAPFKESPLDFVLWKPSVGDDPGFDSPWGYGRPGWHIECSAMSAKYLSDAFDIHGGGQDLIFPHHENEIAQSRCASGKSCMAKYWVHNGMLLVDGKKMSKSLGNIVTVSSALKKYSGNVLKYFILSTHYSKTLDWTDSGLAQAQAAFDRLTNAADGLDSLHDDQELDHNDPIMLALCEDLNTSKALMLMVGLAKQIGQSGDPKENPGLIQRLSAAMHLLGFTIGAKRAGQVTEGQLKEINGLISERIKARAQKQFQKSDELRDVLKERFCVTVKDNPNGTTSWSFEYPPFLE
ncbi:MAG: cysteine--tRNA ligase [Holosporales bacterium]|jgi:cysteinyl-tRNA synthetase|nr:cysteine--tRNA ligase [Holosporales bacterium]